MDSSIISLFCRQADRYRERPVLHVRRGGERFSPVTWDELAGDVRRMAIGLMRMGVEPGDRVVQVSENRYEWVVADLAIQMALAVHVPVHAPLSGRQILGQIADCGARLVLLSGPPQVRKLAGLGDELPAHVRCVAYDSGEELIRGERVPLLADRLADVPAVTDDQIEQTARKGWRPDSLATILYTSGTTGEPKGVMLSQGNLVSNTEAKIAAHGFTAGELRLGVLPLSHVFGRTCDLYVTIATGAELALTASRDTFFDDCAAVRPTYLNAVPYFFDKCFRQLDQPGRAAERGSLRRLLGGRVRSCLCGGAPLPRHVYRFFWEQEVPVVEGYGLTESSPVISDCTLAHNRPGSVGRPIPGVEVRIAEDGEILTRGPHVMLGYWNKPEATAGVLQDGWLLTGDLGHVDEAGFLFITGRKKEMILTAGGRNVFPVPLETLLTEDPLVWQALVVGEGRNCLAALVVPNREVLASRLGIAPADLPDSDDLNTDSRVRQLFEASIARQLRHLAAYEQVRRFAILPRPFSVEQGELTAKQSLRRQVIAKHFADVIDCLYR